MKAGLIKGGGAAGFVEKSPARSRSETRLRDASPCCGLGDAMGAKAGEANEGKSGMSIVSTNKNAG